MRADGERGFRSPTAETHNGLSARGPPSPLPVLHILGPKFLRAGPSLLSQPLAALSLSPLLPTEAVGGRRTDRRRMWDPVHQPTRVFGEGTAHLIAQISPPISLSLAGEKKLVCACGGGGVTLDPTGSPLLVLGQSPKKRWRVKRVKKHVSSLCRVALPCVRGVHVSK